MNAPTSEGATNFATVDWPQLLPGNLTTIRFPGSRTTPDCTEGLA